MRLKHSFTFKTPLWILCAGLSLHASGTAAFGYGIFDARGLAMGGSAVAIGDPSQAMYYSPALLSFHDGDEEQALDGRAYTPTLVAQASTPIESAVKATNDNLDREIRGALDAFNAQMSPDNASLVATSSRDLRKVLEKVANRDLYLDGFIGISASQPADREGGAFYVGVRTVGVATSNISS